MLFQSDKAIRETLGFSFPHLDKRERESYYKESQELFEALIRNPGFLRLVEIRTEDVNRRMNMLLESVGVRSAKESDEYLKGSIHGTLLTLRTPQSMLLLKNLGEEDEAHG